jgi:methylaspartate ammonia-lyase
VLVKIKKVICAVGKAGYMHLDMAAIRGGASADGGIFIGAPVTPGFKRIAEPAEIMSIMLLLEDGQVAFGDCADVIFAGAAGRDTIFHPSEHLSLARTYLAAALVGRDVGVFKANANELDAWVHQGRRLHTAVRYGVTQALLHATSLAHATTMAEVVASDYKCQLSSKPIALLANCHNNDLMQLDRMILKRVELLPHAYFTSVENELGHRGQKLVAWLAAIAKRVRDVGEADYRPRLHIDVYGTIGQLFESRVEDIADYLGELRAAAQPYDLLVESPLIAPGREEQIEKFLALRQALGRKEIAVPVVVDEWCNTLEDIEAFTEAGAADFVQVKTPDLGGLNNTIEAVLYCRSKGMGVCLGGTGNETDQSTRICAHIGLATQPDFMLSKPGLGGDEAIMIQTNEMARALALAAQL